MPARRGKARKDHLHLVHSVAAAPARAPSASMARMRLGWLQKFFWGGGRKFLELMRFTRGDVRGHIVSSKIDHRPACGVESDAAAEKAKDQLSRDFLGCSILDFCNTIRGKADIPPQNASSLRYSGDESA